MKREKEAKVRERKGRGVLELEIGPRYSAGSCAGIDRPGGDDVALEEALKEKAQIVLAYEDGKSEVRWENSSMEEDKKRWRVRSEKREAQTLTHWRTLQRWT